MRNPASVAVYEINSHSKTTNQHLYWLYIDQSQGVPGFDSVSGICSSRVRELGSPPETFHLNNCAAIKNVLHSARSFPFYCTFFIDVWINTFCRLDVSMQLIGSSNFVNIAAARIRNENIWVANGTMQYIYCQINVLYVNVDNCDESRRIDY